MQPCLPRHTWTGESTLRSPALPRAGYSSLQPGVGPPLSTQEVATTGWWLRRSLRRHTGWGCSQESSLGPGIRRPACAALWLPGGLGKRSPAWASGLRSLDRLHGSPGAQCLAAAIIQRQQGNDASKGSGRPVPSASILQRHAGRALGQQGGPPPSNRHSSCNTRCPPSSRKCPQGLVIPYNYILQDKDV